MIVKFLIDNIKYIIFALCLIFAALFLHQCSVTNNLKANAEQQSKINQQNLKALNDHVRKTLDKKNEEVYEKMSFVANKISDLENLNKELHDKLLTVDGKPKVYVETKIIYHTETKYLPTVLDQTSDSSWNAKWKFMQRDSGSYQALEGYTPVILTGDTCHRKVNVGETVLTKNEMSFDIDMGVKDNAKGDSTVIFVKPYSKNVSIGKINGVTMIPKIPKGYEKKKHFSLGPCAAVGYTPTGQILPMAGLSVQWMWLKW